MIPATFHYQRARSVEHALDVLTTTPEAKVIAGGHSLVPLLKMRLAQPSVLVDIGRLAELDYITVEGGSLRIGALARHQHVATSETVRTHSPLLAEVAATVGDPQVRHRGTMGGTVAHGDPAADIPTALLTLDATVTIVGASGRRDVPVHAFFRGLLETDVGEDELVTAVSVPAQPAGSTSTYLKFRRRAQDWATVGVAVQANWRSGLPRVAVGLTSMGLTPLRATEVERQLLDSGKRPAAAIVEAASLADAGTSPPSDTNGSAEYRRHLARVLTRRALEHTLAQSEESSR